MSNHPIHRLADSIFIASDHAGWELKAALQKALPHYRWIDLGPSDANRVDYPDYARLLAEKILAGSTPLGILICGTGLGMSIAANKTPGIRAAVVENPVCARLAREHNNANVLCLGARFVAVDYAAEITEAWLKASFDESSRHAERIKKIHKMESPQ